MLLEKLATGRSLFTVILPAQSDLSTPFRFFLAGQEQLRWRIEKRARMARICQRGLSGKVLPVRVRWLDWVLVTDGPLVYISAGVVGVVVV